jgi:sporulation protein YlmC with PRC-barrel domain
VTAPIDDLDELPGRDVIDQVGAQVGKVKALFAPGGEGEPMWVTIELKEGMVSSRLAVVPCARLKDEAGVVTVPYSCQHIRDAPEVDIDGEISLEDDRTLRDYYGIGRGDEPSRDVNPDLYSVRVREEEEPSQPLES